MSNTILTPTAVTRECARILHQKLNFVGRIDRQYDKEFAEEGAKIGDSLKIRLPNEYTVTDGAVMVAQDTSETSTTLQIDTQKHVGMNFTSKDLTLSLDDFKERIIEPAMSVLAAAVEASALTMYKDVYNQVNNVGAVATFRKLMDVRKKLNDNLAPMDNSRTMILNTTDNADLVDAMKGLFQDSTAVKEQYREGGMGRTAGFEFYENTLLANHTSGTDTSAYTVNGANQTGSTLAVATGAGTLVQGDIITLAGCNRVHPETKADTGELQQFVVTEAYAGGAGNITISPAITTSGARQNCAASPTNGGAITKIGGNAEVYGVSLGFHKNAFTLATADLVMPPNVWGARVVQDGISLRVLKQYDINNDKLPCRVDVLFGKKAYRPQLASRFANN